jgi:DNA-binding NtrC family response regulator
VRELQNVIERAVALSAGARVEVEDLPDGLRKPSFRPVTQDEIRPLHEIERKYVLAAFELAKGDKKLAATKLDIGLRTLYRKLEEYGVR